MNIILYLLQTFQALYRQNCWLVNFICRYIPLKQWAFDDSHSPKYQKFKIDELPKIISFKQDWDWKDLISYYKQRYGKTIKPAFRRAECGIPGHCSCPACDAPSDYLMWNNGKKKSQLRCKVCQTLFSPTRDNRFSKTTVLRCPHCNHALVRKKDRRHFAIHKCVNPQCPYYLYNLKKVDKRRLEEDYGKNRYKLHYIYREFTMDFFKLDLNSLPKNASSLKFTKFDSNTMSLCLTLHVNLGLSLRKTRQALLDLYGISISHQSIANYCKSAAMCIKPFVDNYDYGTGSVFTADETYIKIRGVKAYVWFIMDAAKRSIIGYQISDNRGVGPCILAMRMAFRHLKELPQNFRFIADGYSAYPLAAQQFFRKFGDKFRFNITQVIGLTNDDGIKPLLPYKRPMTKDGFFKKYEYAYDEYYDCYICPNNEVLTYRTTNRGGYREYKSSGETCAACPYLSQCTNSKNHVKTVERHIWEPYMEICEDIRQTLGMKELYAQRKETIERLFGTAKEDHGFRYTQMYGKARMEMKVGLTFACMNLKKLAKIKEKRGLLGEGNPRQFSILDRIYRIKEKLQFRQGKWLWKLNPRATLSTV